MIMTTINQKGKGNQLSTGNNSPNKIKVLKPSKREIGWFVSGILLPVMSGIIIELISQGKLSKLFSYLIELFK